MWVDEQVGVFLIRRKEELKGGCANCTKTSNAKQDAKRKTSREWKAHTLS